MKEFPALPDPAEETARGFPAWPDSARWKLPGLSAELLRRQLPTPAALPVTVATYAALHAADGFAIGTPWTSTLPSHTAQRYRRRVRTGPGRIIRGFAESPDYTCSRSVIGT